MMLDICGYDGSCPIETLLMIIDHQQYQQSSLQYQHNINL